MPVLPVTLCAFAAGATLLQWQPELPAMPREITLAALAATILAVIALPVWRRCDAALVARSSRVSIAVSIASAMIVAVLAGLLGFGYAAWRAQVRLADELPQAWEGVDVAVTGIVDEMPQTNERGVRFVLAVEHVETPGAIVPSRLSLTWYAQIRRGEVTPAPPLAAGERWRLVVRLKRPHGTANPHGFDIEAWLLERGLRATGYVRDDGRNERLDSFVGRPEDWVERARERLRVRIKAALPDAKYAGVIVALTIGEQRAIPASQWQLFARTGISHLISISGLHVTVFAALAGALAYAVARRSVRLTSKVPARKLAALVGALAAAGYVLLAGSQIPAERTLLMLVVGALGLWLGRPGTSSIVWLWALAVVVAWDPWAGLTPGFWLSFGSVGLLLYAHAGRIGDPPAPTRTGRILVALRIAARTQFLVTIALVPLTLALFQQVSLASPLANALAIPVVTFAVVPFALAGILLPVDIGWQAAHAIFAAMMVPLEWLAATPGSVWQQHAPPGWSVVTALIGMAWLAAPRGVPGRALGLVWFLPLFVVLPERPGPGDFRLVVLDVGQGLAAVVTTPHHTLLYDTGPRYHDEADAGGRIVAPYLRSSGIARLSGMVVSHKDNDHSGGMATLLESVPVDWLASSLPAEHPGLDGYTAEGGNALRCIAGQRWNWDGIEFQVLHPPAAHYDALRMKTNDLSCVVRVSSAHGSVLLTGDIEAGSERLLLKGDPAALASDVVVVAHHGAATSSIAEFIAATGARMAVFTPGYRNRFGHPKPEVVARWVGAGATPWRTDHGGALTFDFDSGRVRPPRVERERERRYWREAPISASPIEGE